MSDRVCTIRLELDQRLSEASTHSLGEEGQFAFRVVRRRCGTARAFVVRVSTSSNIKRDLIGLSVDMQPQ